MATNAQVAARLGVSHSTVSRMRQGARIGSPEILQRISKEYGIPLEDVMSSAVEARSGELDGWVKLMKDIMTRDPEGAASA